jgi:hypothetical protein
MSNFPHPCAKDDRIIEILFNRVHQLGVKEKIISTGQSTVNEGDIRAISQKDQFQHSSPSTMSCLKSNPSPVDKIGVETNR